jgi:predicted HNH restriction endonuclease
MTPFDFHHPDPTIKEYGGVAGLMSWSNTTKLKQEVAKCILLCKNCHAIEHERLRNE